MMTALMLLLILDFQILMSLTDAVQEQLNMWLVKTQSFLNEVTSPLVRTGHGRKHDPVNVFDTQDIDDIFMAEKTIQSSTPSGDLSLAAIVSIEQFSRWQYFAVFIYLFIICVTLSFLDYYLLMNYAILCFTLLLVTA